MLTIWIFNTGIFHRSFCMWILAYPFVQNDDFFKVPYVSWVWDFVDMYRTHLGTRTWSPLIHIYSKKWFFWPQNIAASLGHMKKKLKNHQLWTLCSYKKLRNEQVRFDWTWNIQASYKIIWLEVPKKAPILYNLPCFQEGLFRGSNRLKVDVDT